MSGNPKILTPSDNVTGVKPELVGKIGALLERGVRHFGSAAASLTHQIHNPKYRHEGLNPKLAEIGLKGEQATSLHLRKWLEENYPNAVLCDSIHIRGALDEPELNEEPTEEEIEANGGFIDDGKDTDHVVILGDCVYIIDTKRWKKKSRYTIADDGSVLRNDRPFPGGRVHARAAKHLWADYLHEPYTLQSFVVINNEEVRTFRSKAWFRQPFKLVEIDRFDELLQKTIDRDKPDTDVIRADLVAQVALCCIPPYDPYKEFLKEAGVKDFI